MIAQTTATAEFLSIGDVCQLVQRVPKQVNAACAALGISPALKLSHVPYFGSTQVESIVAHFREESAR